LVLESSDEVEGLTICTLSTCFGIKINEFASDGLINPFCEEID
jgi:hypothetical protein